MGMGRHGGTQPGMWVATSELPRSPEHTFYDKLNRLLVEADFDRRCEELCEPYYADDVAETSRRGPHAEPRPLLPIHSHESIHGFFNGLLTPTLCCNPDAVLARRRCASDSGSSVPLMPPTPIAAQHTPVPTEP
jgi:hypothetical protein